MDSNGKNPNAGLANGGDINGTLNIDPDLNVTGTITCDILEANTIVSDLEIEDPLIEVAVVNPADSLNTGLFAKYVSSGDKYAGLLRSHVDGTFFLGNNITVKPTAVGTLTNRSGTLKLGILDATSCVDINDYRLPTADGSLNQVITTDGAGTTSFSTVPNPFDQDLNTTDNVVFNSVTTQAVQNIGAGNLDIEVATGELGLRRNAQDKILIDSSDNCTFDNLTEVIVQNPMTINDVLTLNTDKIALGSNAGTGTTGISSIAIGNQAGQNSGDYACAMGFQAGQNQNDYNVAIGFSAGKSSQQDDAVAIGRNAGKNSMAIDAVAIGPFSGENNQKLQSVAVGYQAGQTNLNARSVAIGAGSNATSTDCVSLGQNAVINNHSDHSVCIGSGSNIITGTSTGLGDRCTIVGAGITMPADVNNSMGLGNGANPSIDDECVIGNVDLNHIRPHTTNTTSLGTEDESFRDVWVSNQITVKDEAKNQRAVIELESGCIDSTDAPTTELVLNSCDKRASAIVFEDINTASGLPGLADWRFGRNYSGGNSIEHDLMISYSATKSHTSRTNYLHCDAIASKLFLGGATVPTELLGTLRESTWDATDVAELPRLDTMTNLSIGIGAGDNFSVGSGTHNVAIGTDALKNYNGSSQTAVAIGYRAGSTLNTGFASIFIGSQSGRGSTGLTGSGGTDCICIGVNTQARENEGASSNSNSIALGCNATIIASNEMVIGSSGATLTHLRPGTDNETDLGTSTYQFKDVHLGGVIDSSIGQMQGSTGLYSGGVLSINADTTKFDISAGTGYVYSHDAVNNGATSVVHVTWAEQLAITVTNIAIQSETFITIDSAGTVLQSATDITASQRRDKINIGVLIHTDGVNVGGVDNHPDLSFQVHNAIHDLASAIGKLNISGNGLSPETLLTFSKASGFIFAQNENYTTDDKDPSTVTSAAIDTSGAGRFSFVNQHGNGLFVQSDITPGLWDDGDTLLDAVVANNQWTIQRVVLVANNFMFVLAGQTLFTSHSNAIDGIQTESFIYPANLEANSLLIGYIIVKGNESDLGNSTASVINAGKFGGTSSSSAQTDLQQAYDNSTQPLILTGISDPFSIRRGGSADTELQLSVENGAGTTTFSVDGNGNIDTAGYIMLNDQSAPSNPSNGEGLIYKKTSDDGVFWKPDSAGAEVDLTDDTTKVAKSQLVAVGDIYAATAAGVPGILTVGADDLVLTADNSQATGLRWATAGIDRKIYNSTGAEVTLAGTSTAYGSWFNTGSGSLTLTGMESGDIYRVEVQGLITNSVTDNDIDIEIELLMDSTVMLNTKVGVGQVTGSRGFKFAFDLNTRTSGGSGVVVTSVAGGYTVGADVDDFKGIYWTQRKTLFDTTDSWVLDVQSRWQDGGTAPSSSQVLSIYTIDLVKVN